MDNALINERYAKFLTIIYRFFLIGVHWRRHRNLRVLFLNHQRMFVVDLDGIAYNISMYSVWFNIKTNFDRCDMFLFYSRFRKSFLFYLYSWKFWIWWVGVKKNKTYNLLSYCKLCILTHTLLFLCKLYMLF